MIIKYDNRRVAGSFFVRRHPKFDVSAVPGIPVFTHLTVLPDSSRIKISPATTVDYGRYGYCFTAFSTMCDAEKITCSEREQR